jgi:hypothetical protein
LTRSQDSKNVQIGITTSVVLHVLLFLLLAWVSGLDQAASSLLRKAKQAAEEPTVTLLFPEQILPTPVLKPKLDTKSYIRTTQNEAVADKPVKSDFISDRNTKAASKEAAFPDATAPMPSMKGIDQPTLELANRSLQDGKPANDNAAKPAPLMLAQLAPQEPKTLPMTPPKEVAKAEPTPMAKMMEQLDKAEVTLSTAKLPIEVKKPSLSDEPIPQMAPPKEALPLPSTQVTPPAMKEFSPFTETARTKGTISNLGEAAVDAEATEMGKFMRTVTSAVEKKWHLLRRTHADAVSYGYLKVRFFVNREGRPEDVKFIEKANNPQMEDFTLEAILKAEIPPIPRDLLPMLDGERFPVEYEIIIHD